MSQEKRGIIYYNTGQSCLVRLLVSLHSLRKWYQGPVAIVSEGEESHSICDRIASALDAQVIHWESTVPEGKNHAYLAKTRLNKATPFDTTVALDADTLVVGELDSLFPVAEKHAFCVAQFAQWKTSGRICSRRIVEWRSWLPDDIEPALSFGPAINIGVMAFRRDASIFDDWSDAAPMGRELFIPDEISCQILLHRHPHHILASNWNCSCKYDNPLRAEVRVIHYHGRKHCRRGLPFHGILWMEGYKAVVQQDLAGVQTWGPAGDRMLRKYLKAETRENRQKSRPQVDRRVSQEAREAFVTCGESDGSSHVVAQNSAYWCSRGHFDAAQAGMYSSLCRSLRPRYVLEIGFCTGRSASCVLLNSASSLERMISIDKDLGYRPPGRRMAALLMRDFPGYAVIEGDSHELLSETFFSKWFPQGLDLVLVDGDHSYEGCAADLKAAASHINSRGVIVVDDYNSGPPNGIRFESVNRAVEDFMSANRGLFAMEAWSEGGKGMCLIRPNSNVKKRTRDAKPRQVPEDAIN